VAVAAIFCVVPRVKETCGALVDVLAGAGIRESLLAGFLMTTGSLDSA
jgi:hypothetical protein